MPDQKNFAQPYDDSFEFKPGSSSSSAMNQRVLWNNMLFNPTEVQSMTGRTASPEDINIPCLNMANQDDAQLSIWGSRGSSSSSQHHQQGIREDNKREHGWTPSITITSRRGPTIEENHSYGSPILSLDTANRSLNVAQVDGIPSFPQNNPRFNNLQQNREIAAAQVGSGNDLSESVLSHPPYMLGLFDGESVSVPIDLSISGESSENVGLLREDDDRPENLLDERRISCKRKNSEGFLGQSSVSANASSSQQGDSSFLYSHIYNPVTTSISSSAEYPSIAPPPEEYPATLARGVASDCYASPSTAGHAETSRRNHRVRINPALAHPNSWLVNTTRQSDSWLYNQPPSFSISPNQSLEPTQVLPPTSSQNQPLIPVVPGLPQIVYHFPWSGPSNSRIGTSSGSFSAEDRSFAAREANQSSNMLARSNLELVPATSVRNMSQHRTNRNLDGRIVNMAMNSQAGTSSGLHPTLGSSWVPRQNPTQFSQPLAEATYRPLFQPGSSESGGQGINFPPQHSGHSLSSQEVAQIRASLRGPPPTSHARSPNLLRRRNHGLFSAPISLRNLTAAGEERSRMLSEIRHALESLRRGDGLRLEDVVILDQTLILAGSDLHDRHRDMRLDVDNMSYEELLALEERIGDVCTGLNEEKVIKCLKQQKHSSTMEHDEPCCICQEEYVEGDELGILDCGHNFHTACIKQWLMHKNLCPICKNSALHT
ncbi:probable E3 ubiquitin-protein ligase HIP1 [Zingiber officinale]|uniref:RING-type E3 ubiquitin transferase n=1 Tax=Zingiber officinale TaxID=94328 RepID=A0A8J5KPF5_ZINOF|nr:probable E3 ubiquitin-protein ligase HIP1 [Zingiber officinale]KAG6486034.1 hypothetical protein ZIOFF_054604 [Zingiber officinale]